MYIHESLCVGCVKPPFSSSLQHSPPPCSDRCPGNHHSVCLVILRVQACVVNFLQRSSCRGLQCEIRESGAAALTFHRDPRATETSTCPAYDSTSAYHITPQLWPKLFRASLKSEFAYIFRRYILKYAKRKEGQLGNWPWRTFAGLRVSSVCMLGSHS